MFHIFGSPRSGTTLLAQCLNAHPGLVVPYETDFIIPAAFLCDRIRDPAVGRDLVARMIVSSEAYPASIGQYLDAGEVGPLLHSCEYACAAILDVLYTAVAERAGGKIAGDKSPNDLLYLRILVKTGGIAPTAPILHIVRDVRDVVASLHAQQWVEDLDLYFARFWNNANLYLHQLYRNNTSQYLLLRYEDMVADPEAEIGRACRHLGVEFERTMLDPSNRDPRYLSNPAHTRLYEEISDTQIGRYRSDLGSFQVETCQAQADEGLKAFGYL